MYACTSIARYIATDQCSINLYPHYTTLHKGMPFESFGVTNFKGPKLVDFWGTQ